MQQCFISVKPRKAAKSVSVVPTAARVAVKIRGVAAVIINNYKEVAIGSLFVLYFSW